MQPCGVPISITVLPRYSEEKLFKFVYGLGNDEFRHVPDTQQTAYFRNYFRQKKPRTLVWEPEYTDHDFLEDFAAYYVRCFEPYERFCGRLHLFTCRFSPEQFRALIKGKNGLLTSDYLQEHYLGFIVAKPLPRTAIGRTCLETYKEDKGRHYPITRSYDSHLFGLTFTVETLAFQEQDRVVAACASSALWSVLQGTGKLFQHSIPSPVEITRMARSNPLSESRTLPNSGLFPAEIAAAIRAVGLEPFPIEVKDEYSFIGNLYAYLKGKIPLLLALSLDGVMFRRCTL